jgi:excisionase family DNA binding protein
VKPEIMTLKEVANLLRVPDHAIKKMVREGKIPHLFVGEHMRFTRSSLRKWVKESIAAPGCGWPHRKATLVK